jgi:hypothetical protein
VTQQIAFEEQQAAAARKALPIEARRQAARVMFAESVAAGMPMTAQEVGEAFGRSIRWGRDRMNEVRGDLAETADPAETAADTKAAREPETSRSEPASEPTAPIAEDAKAVPAYADQAVTVPVDTQPATPVTDASRLASLTQHIRVRWGVRATLALGVVASTVANILHAHDNLISQTIAAWPPLALLVTIELISRVPVHRRSLAAVRFAATATIAGIAAWVSYWHMAEVIHRYGETGESPYLIPLTVDGLVVVASVCLVELGSRIRTLTTQPVRVQ